MDDEVAKCFRQWTAKWGMVFPQNTFMHAAIFSLSLPHNIYLFQIFTILSNHEN